MISVDTSVALASGQAVVYYRVAIMNLPNKSLLGYDRRADAVPRVPR